MGIDLGEEPAPDEASILKFLHMLKAHDLSAQLFVLIDAYLEENRLKVGEGAIVDATIIKVPSETKK